MRLLPSSWSRFPDPAGDDAPALAPGRWRIWLAAGGGALVLLAAAAFWLAPKVERRLEQRSVREAREFLQQQDYRRAELMLGQAVQDDPADFETRRELAKFYEEAGSSRALTVWRQLVRDEPGNDDDRIGLALAGLRLGDLTAAHEGLAGVSPQGRAGVAYNQAAAAIALRAGDRPALAAALAVLARLEPDDPHAQFNHAGIEMTSGDPAQMEAARAELIRLARGGPVRIRATLALIRDATRRGGPTVYTDLANRILPPPPGTFSAPWLGRPRGLFDLIQHMEAQPNPGPEDAAVLADWMRRQGLASDAVLWMNSLDPGTRNDPVAAAALVACLAQIRDWRGVEAGIRTGAWGRAPAEAIDLAFAARLQRERLHLDHASDTWNDALEVAAKSPEALRMMLRLAQAFGWPDAATDALWALTRAAPRDAAAWQALAVAAASHGATVKLLDVYNAWSRSVPDDPAVRGVRMWVAVLLGRAGPADFEIPGPSNPAYGAALALALRGAGRGSEAEATLARLPAAALGDPRVALVRGLLLTDEGQREDAAPSLALAASGPLLPEERALLESAQPKSDGPASDP